MAMQELLKNKLRTFLSLFGVTIGILCIIGVLATVQSLEYNIKTEIKSLGTNTIYIDKWEYGAGGGPDYPWWKYVKRPSPKYEELKAIKERTASAKFAAFKISVNDNVQFNDNLLKSVNIYGISEDFSNIQPIEIQYGRYLSEAEFDRGSNAVVIGYEIAEKLFSTEERAIGKLITVRGKKLVVAGVIKKQGTQMIGGWRFDQSILIPYKFARNIMDERRADPLIMVQGKENINSKILKDDLKSTMRAIHKLSPTQEDDFALNDINDISDALSSAFKSINIGGWAIGALSFIVGIFGVANIMFVTVKERTSQIGVKKAIGAKSRVILSEFLAEAAFLCLIGGLIGLLLVYVMTKIVFIVFEFPIFLSASIITVAILICIGAGIMAGIVPAIQAARMNPVVAIRSS
ncbi:MAG: ABC transporter permease [Chitinophagaceae bacterium]|nr:ABC transporter permease [Chitinophagaceae bacterium]